ncbi:MAG: hypothetical protein QOI68_1304 [Pseudonocardiales bacterium]|nr:hypothetical protein [Pseudonocardiales bacterium]
MTAGSRRHFGTGAPLLTTSAPFQSEQVRLLVLAVISIVDAITG